MIIKYDSPTNFDINYDPAHLIVEEKRQLRERQRVRRNSVQQAHGICRYLGTVMRGQSATMARLDKSITNTRQRYKRHHLAKLRARRDQLEQFHAERNWGLRAGDVLSTLNWSEKKRQELDKLYDLIDRLDFPIAYAYDDTMPLWVF